MIKKTPSYAYFTLSFNYIIKNSFLTFIFFCIEYYVILIHLLESIIIGLLPSSYEGDFTKDFFINNLSIFYHFKKIKFGLVINGIKVYHWSIPLIIMIIESFYFVYYYYLDTKITNKIINTIIINLYDYLYFRILAIFVFDAIINYLLASATTANDSLSPSINILLILLTMIILIIFIGTYLNHFILFFTFVSIQKDQNYPFDIISKNFDVILLFTKIVISLQNNLYLNGLQITLLIRCLTIITLISLTIQMFALLFFFIKMPSLFLFNFTHNKIRFAFILIAFLWIIIILFQGYFYVCMFYLLGISAVVLCSIIAFVIDQSMLMAKFYLHDMTPFNQMIMLLELSKGNDLYQKVYKEKIHFHLGNCTSCNFCDVYYSSINKEANQHLSTENELHMIFNCYLHCYLNNLHVAKNYLHKIYEDLFKVLQKTFESKGMICFQFRYHFQLLIRKYMGRNEKAVAMNLMMIYEKSFECKTVDNAHIINMIKIYIVLVKKIKKILDDVSSFIVSENKSPRLFLELGREIHSLKKNNQMEFLMNRKNSVDYCVILIIFIFEEITNRPINKERGLVKEELLSYEDMLNIHYNQSKNMIMLFDPYKKMISIKKAGNDMFHFVGRDLTSLFPKEIRADGEKRFFDSLNTAETIKEFEFIIQTHDNKYVQFYLRFMLLYETLDTDLYINAEYFLSTHDVILTRYQKDIGENSEVLFGNSTKLYTKKDEGKESNQSTHDVSAFLKKTSTDSGIVVTINGINISLQLKYTFLNDYYCYNVYLPLKHQFKGTSINQTALSVFENHNENKSAIFRYEDGTSYCNSGSSVFSVQSHSQKEKAAITINIEKKYKQYQSRFVKTTKLTLVFCIIIIVFSIISLIVELNSNARLLDSYSVYTQLRAVNRLFYNTITSILAVVCIGELNSGKCINYYEEYNKRYNLENDIDYPSFYYSVYENPLKVADFGTGLSKLKSKMYSLNDPKATEIFYHWFDYTFLSVVDSNITIMRDNTTFVNALEILFNGLMIIIKSNRYYTHPVYIISLEDFNFSNIYQKNQLEAWQIEYYNLVINYQKYLDNWVNIQISLSDNTNSQLTSLSNLVIICLNISNILHLCLFSLLFYFIFSFTNLFILNMNKLMYKMKKEDFTNFLIVKYKHLMMLSNFFEKNPVGIIKDINLLYNDYIITPKTPGNILKITPQMDNNQQIINYFSYKDYYEIVQKFYKIIFSILAYYLMIFIVFLVIWCINEDNILNVFNIITDNTVSACSGYNIFALAQLMVLVNETQAQLSVKMNHKGDDYLIYESMRSLEVVLRLEVQRKSVGGLMKTTNDFIDLNCDSFYSDIKDIRFEVIDSKYPDKEFRSKYPPFCKTFNIMEYKNDAVFYKTIFYEIHKIVNSITKFEYEDLLGYLTEGSLFYLSDLQFLLYRPFRSWFNDVVYTDAINGSINLEKTILFCILGITIASEIVIFVFLYFQLFKRLNTINGILIGVKNVFKIVK